MEESLALKPPENFDFPFKPYDIQHEFMKNLYQIIEDKNLGIFESPTGTGKSLSIICGALKWLKDHQTRETEVLKKEIDKLEKEIEELNKEKDWFKSQSKAVLIKEKLIELKLKQKKIDEYEEKIRKIIERTKKAKNNTNNSKPHKKATKSEKTVEVFDEEEFLLEDLIDSSSDDEESENEKYEPIKIFICSRTHSQLTQFVGEIIKSPFGEKIRVVTLGSRQNCCINDTVKKLKNISLINERCLDLQKNEKKSKKTDCEGKVIKRKRLSELSKCEYFKGNNIEDLKDSILTRTMDIEDLVTSGKELKACPYYASRKAAEDSEIVLVPYNTILHKPTREANGIKLKNNVIIIDEAHNLLESMTQMYSSELNYLQIFYAEKQLAAYKNKYNLRFSSFNLLKINQLLFVMKNLRKFLENDKKSQVFSINDFVLKAEIDNQNMFGLVKFCKESRIAQKIRGFAIKHPEIYEKQETPKKGIREFLSKIENKTQQTTNQTETEITQTNSNPIPSNPLLALISFMETLTYSYEDGRIIMFNSSQDNEKKLQFMVLNPIEHFKEIVRESRSIIVAGGTMKPIEEFRNRLFRNSGAEILRIKEFCCDHIVPEENILPIILGRNSKGERLRFDFENRFSMGENIKEILIKTCDKIPGGIVVFFPSYKYESWVWEKIKNVNFQRETFREPQNSSDVETVLGNYAKCIEKKKKALLLSVVGGKLSEGLNFSDDLGRCVIVIGLPYANIQALDLKEKMNYLDKTEGTNAGNKFYEDLCMKSVNQCIGRAIRHKNDYATVILLDERYGRNSSKNALPEWIKKSLVCCDFQECFSKIDLFFQNKSK